MVKVVEKSPQEKKRDQNHRDLMAITAKVAGKENIADLAGLTFLVYGAKGICVDPFERVISVRDERFYDHAFQLAKLYEERTSEEFTLKKEYE